MSRFRLQSAILSAVLLLALGAGCAQQPPAESPKPQNPVQQERRPVDQDSQPRTQQNETQTSTGGELAQASKEAAGEEENAQFKHSPSVQLIARITGLSLHAAYWVSIFINFAVLALLIVLISRSKLPAMFRTRTGEIQRGITEARKASEDANRRLADVEARLARLDAEVAHMRAAADEEAAVEEQRIMQAAEDEKRKIVESANAEIGAAAKLAQRELKAFAADLAVSLAEKQIHVNSEADRALVSNFVEQLDGSDSPGKEGR